MWFRFSMEVRFVIVTLTMAEYLWKSKKSPIRAFELSLSSCKPESVVFWGNPGYVGVLLGPISFVRIKGHRNQKSYFLRKDTYFTANRDHF